MKALRMALINVAALRRRLAGLTIMLAIAVGVCITSFAIADSVERVSTDQIQEAVANRSLIVERQIERPQSTPLTDASLREVSALPGVASVEPRLQVSFGYKDETVPGVLLYATTVRPSLTPPIKATTRDKLFPLKSGEAVLPRTAEGSDLGPLLGKKIKVETIRKVAEGQGEGRPDTVTVVGLFDPTWQLDGPGAAYLGDDTVVKWSALGAGVPTDSYTRLVGYDRVTVVAENAAAVPALLESIQHQGYAATSFQQQLTELPGALSVIQVASRALLVALGILALAGTLSVTGALLRQRRKEIGIMKAVGFRNRTVFTMLIGEAVLTALAATAAGLALGLGGAVLLAHWLREDLSIRDRLTSAFPLPSATTVGLVLAVTIVVVTAGSLAAAVRAARMDPADAIKEW